MTRDVHKLRSFGSLRPREQISPGHGVVQIVKPIARKLEMCIAVESPPAA